MAYWDAYRDKLKKARDDAHLASEHALRTQRILEDKQLGLWACLRDEAAKAAERINSGAGNLLNFFESEQDFRFVVRHEDRISASASFDAKSHCVYVSISRPATTGERYQYMIHPNKDGQVEFSIGGVRLTPTRVIESMLSWLAR